MRRVLWVIKGLGPGGAERLLAAHAARHDASAFDITCAYVLPAKDHLADELEQHGVTTRCVSVRARDLGWPLRLARLVRSGDWDVVHVHSPLPGSVSRLAARTLQSSSRPTVIDTEHNVWTSHRPSTRWLNRVTSRWNDSTLAVSTEVLSSFTGRLSTLSDVIAVRHGIDVDRVAALRTERATVRRELGLDDRAVVVGTVANYRAQKDYPNLLRAIAHVVDVDPSVRLVAVGQGPDAAAVRRCVDELGLTEAVTLTGFRADAARIMAACDVFVLASKWEGLPVAIMEAAALGLPIVATDVGGVSEELDDGSSALLVPPSDPIALGAALLRVAHDADLQVALSDGASAKATDFDAAVSVGLIEARYRSSPTGPDRIDPDPSDDRRPPSLPPPRRTAPALISGVEIRPATPTDRPAILALCRTALGWGDDPRFGQLFAWKHDDNVFGPSHLWVAVDGSEIVGIRAFMRWEFVRGTELHRAVRAVDTAVHPDHQGRGLFTALTLHGLDEVRAAGVDFVFNTPNEQSLPGYLKMGWGEIGRLPVHLRPNGAGGALTAARSRVAASHWPELDRPVGIAADRSLDADLGVVAGASDRRLSTRTDDEVLRWRYGLPMLGYRRVAAGDGSIIVRLRRRGPSRELVVLHHAGASAEQLDQTIGAALDASGATHALSLEPVGSRRRWVQVPRMGPTLAWRGVHTSARPHRSNWNLDMGDIELF